MTLLRVGLKTGDLVGLDHKQITLRSPAGHLLVTAGAGDNPYNLTLGSTTAVSYDPKHSALIFDGLPSSDKVLVRAGHDGFWLKSRGAAGGDKQELRYIGELELKVHGNGIRAVLITNLEDYVRGVLQSEIPANYKLEAMKAQAVVARTYGLHPRLPHDADGFDVCDSFLHCQAFYGVRELTSQQSQAIAQTRSELLMYQDKPALAMFSACAGGHTENYENCFSDPRTNAFPPPPIAYLRGVPEGKLPAGYPSEEAMRKLFSMDHPDTDDAWSAGNFRWRVNVSADALEAHMHHYLETLQGDAQFAPFIQAPQSEKFGHIKKFTVTARGAAGTAISLNVSTSTGDWLIKKELTIRSLFQNPDIGLKRLKSARILIDHTYDAAGLLSQISIFGFGAGHGVGLQQVGAQGLASAGKTYIEIIKHYYPGAELKRL